MLRYHLPPYEKVKSLLTFYLSSVRTLVTRHGGSQCSDPESKANNDGQHPESRKGSRAVLLPGKLRASIGLSPSTNYVEKDVTTTHTYIGAGTNDQDDQVGVGAIHLRYDLQQSWLDTTKSEGGSDLSPV